MPVPRRLGVPAVVVLALAGCTARVGGSSAATSTTSSTTTTTEPYLIVEPPPCPPIPRDAAAAPVALQSAAPNPRIVLARSAHQCWLGPGTYDPQDPATWPKGWTPNLPRSA